MISFRMIYIPADAITKVILTNNDVGVLSKEVQELTKEKLLRAKLDLLNSYCEREYTWLSAHLNKMNGAYSQIATIFINEDISHYRIKWVIQAKEALGKCLPQDYSTQARSAKTSYKNICAIIEHYERLEEEEKGIDELSTSSAGPTWIRG